MSVIPTGSEPQEWTVCRDVARTHGRSFYLASRMLGRERRRAIHAAYAYCRIADDIVDRADGDRAATERALDAWEAQIERPEHPIARAFARSRADYDIPKRPVYELFDGMRADLRITRYENWADLRGYCYQAAGTVGLIVAPILGCADARALPRAAELGIAMQLTNILRDVGEDGHMGRLYLPLDELERFGVCSERLLEGRSGPEFAQLMRFQVDRARALYRSALAGVPALSPAGRVTTLLAAGLYAGILDEIERSEFDVLQRRAVVSRTSKGRYAAIAAARFLWIQSGRGANGIEAVPAGAAFSQPDAEGGMP